MKENKRLLLGPTTLIIISLSDMINWMVGELITEKLSIICHISTTLEIFISS